MYFKDLTRALVRRWYLVVIGLACTAALCAGAASKIGPTYEVNSSSVMMPGKATVVEGGNPFLFLGGLTLARDVLVRSLASPEVEAQILETHPDASFTIAGDTTTSGPIILVTADASTPEAAQATMANVLATLPRQLTQLQSEAQAPDDARITLLPLSTDAEVTVVTKARTRALLAAAALGVIATVLVTGLVDGILLARRRRTHGGGTRRRRSYDLAGSSPELPQIAPSEAVQVAKHSASSNGLAVKSLSE